MTFSQEIIDTVQEQLLEIPAQRLKEKLKPIISRQAEMTKRWFWELLQNASDYNQDVDVKVEINDDQLIFSHNGAPFKIKDVLNIISPNSNKPEEERGDTIGKFGSGFISTHVISSFVTIKGVALSETHSLFKFEVALDRGQYDNKSSLMRSIQSSTKIFAESKEAAEYDPKEFQTKIIYNLNKPLGPIDSKKVVKEGISYLQEILPYTLCFMPKVKSVHFINSSSFVESFSEYRISIEKIEKELIQLDVTKDGQSSNIEMLKYANKDISTVVHIQDQQVQPFPKYLSKIFCGLPMIGTEEVGFPILINSLKFEPNTERDGIELSPNDFTNRGLFKLAAELYGVVLEKLSESGYDGLYHLTKLSYQFNSIESNKIWFKGELMNSVKSILLKSNILTNVTGKKIPLGKALIPSSTEYEDEIFSVAHVFKPQQFPNPESFKYWSENLNFSILTGIAYSFHQFLTDVTHTKRLEGFVLHADKNKIEWLKEILNLVIKVDATLLHKFALLPNRSLSLCLKNTIYHAEDWPEQIIGINDELNEEHIGDELLHPNFLEFASFLEKDHIRSKAFICNRVDDALKNKYSNPESNPATYLNPLRNLIKWFQNTTTTKEELKRLFPWFERKQAQLFLETFNEKQRDQALSIVQSGKFEALAELAKSQITAEQILSISSKASHISRILAMLQDEIDDTLHINEETGAIGEEIVFKDLTKTYPTYQGYEVIWSSKELDEKRFDFEIKKSGETLYFVDAKTTVRGINNADSIPFFIRKSQYDFLSKTEMENKYLIARVFLGGQLSINYFRISLTDNLR
jgi:hypothetical protein